MRLLFLTLPDGLFFKLDQEGGGSVPGRDGWFGWGGGNPDAGAWHRRAAARSHRHRVRRLAASETSADSQSLKVGARSVAGRTCLERLKTKLVSQKSVSKDSNGKAIERRLLLRVQGWGSLLSNSRFQEAQNFAGLKKWLQCSAVRALAGCYFALVICGAWPSAQNLSCPVAGTVQTVTGTQTNVASVCLIDLGSELDVASGGTLNNYGPHNNDGILLNEGTLKSNQFCLGPCPGTSENTVYNALSTLYNFGQIKMAGAVLNTGLIIKVRRARVHPDERV